MKVLVNEDHEDLKSVAKAKGGLHLEFTFAGEPVSEKLRLPYIQISIILVTIIVTIIIAIVRISQ